LTIRISELNIQQTKNYLHNLVTPRPIALASTIDKSGNVNLSAFSFFNVFSIHPPIIFFSVEKRMNANIEKHTLENMQEVPEVSVNIVTYDIIHQVNIAGSEYHEGVNEFIKAGFTEKQSTMIRPPIVAEAKASFECKVNAIHPFGDKRGSSHLVIAEVLCIHINDELLNCDNKLMIEKMDIVARLGGDHYARINADNMFQIARITEQAIGMENLPQFIRENSILTNNHLAQLASVKELPDVDETFDDERVEAMHQYLKGQRLEDRIHQYAKELIDEGKIEYAWQVLLSLRKEVPIAMTNKS
jgi:flavin reductase (DIM6/NTAB) family NADH-FMN oxidoreductase RutF